MRNRIDIVDSSKVIIEDMIRRGFFRDTQTLIAAALNTLQAKLANDTYTDEYEEDSYQESMDQLQLYQEAKDNRDKYAATKKYHVR